MRGFGGAIKPLPQNELRPERDVLGRGYMDSLKPFERLDASKNGNFLKCLHRITDHVSYNGSMLTMTYEYKLEPNSDQIAIIWIYHHKRCSSSSRN